MSNFSSPFLLSLSVVSCTISVVSGCVTVSVDTRDGVTVSANDFKGIKFYNCCVLSVRSVCVGAGCSVYFSGAVVSLTDLRQLWLCSGGHWLQATNHWCSPACCLHSAVAVPRPSSPRARLRLLYPMSTHSKHLRCSVGKVGTALSVFTLKIDRVSSWFIKTHPWIEGNAL